LSAEFITKTKPVMEVLLSLIKRKLIFLVQETKKSERRVKESTTKNYCFIKGIDEPGDKQTYCL
jgi:hypothetical protein